MEVVRDVLAAIPHGWNLTWPKSSAALATIEPVLVAGLEFELS
jgi:hypothetical protein